ncbi:MAG: tetratricopeptide repeat protein [Bacteroidales bacterium]|nr:tetratricopeptide repeat protein [Bacteroidales bacterium]
MKKFLLPILALIVFVACQPTKESRLDRIATLERQTMQDSREISKERADSLLSMYDAYILDFPTDTNSAIMLYKAADVSTNVMYCDKAIIYLERLVGDFPNSNMVEIAKFKMGGVYEKACNNKEKAKEAYGKFVQEYPNSPLARDAAILFQMLDMPDEMDLIRQFELKNAETKTTEEK